MSYPSVDEAEPFYIADGETYVPTKASVGPWDPNSLHGRVVVGLLGGVIEQRHGGEAYIPARLTVDMYRLPDLSPITVKTTLIRDGKRIKVVDAEMFSKGQSVARATCQLLGKSANPDGSAWSPPAWTAPAPEDMPIPADKTLGMRGMFRLKPIVGGMGSAAPKQLWMSEARNLFGGVPLTPFSRVALAADYASPFANRSAEGLGWINTDVSLYLHRLPVGDWIGFEVVNHEASDGIAIAECRLHDEKGAIGTASTAALAQRVMMRRPGPVAAAQKVKV